MTDDTSNAAGIAAVRRFNRFYTRQIGVLRQGLLDSPFSLAEARVLYEIAHRQQPTATELGQDLQLDAGYLSRILRAFEKRGLLRKQASPTDARQSLLSLAAAGRKAQLALEAGSNAEVGTMLAALPADSRPRILQAMQTIERLLGAPQATHEPYLLRTHRPGDMGWTVHRHGALYAQEYGWDETFEALVAEIVAKFVHNFDPRRERCWIAERDGAIMGSVFLVKHSASTAQLRLLLVEPSARGLGIGRRLVEECIRFARQCGYSDITLWTNDILLAARRIYESAGFKLTGEKPHHSFGHDLVGQTWELRL
ncbi:MAG: MarR family transcriptional regulator [Nevskia sp.]|nr:MarR family transcriptional regulator [Nevskia sp.]